MNKKSRIKNHEQKTGIRNSNLFCFNCGGSHIIEYPIGFKEFTQLLHTFDQLHTKCKPTWVEPVNVLADQKTEVENELWWITHGEHGISAKTMLRYLTDNLKDYIYLCPDEGNPHDPDDFKRCYKLLQAIPTYKQKLYRMCKVSPIWNKLIQHWSELTVMYEKKDKKMYDLMRKIESNEK